VAKAKPILACAACRQQVAQWVGRCPGCGEWGTIQEAPSASSSTGMTPSLLDLANGSPGASRVPTGLDGLDRVLGGGLVGGSVLLLAGEPGIGKSTLLLQVLAHLANAGMRCLLVSGEESREQVGSRAHRLGLAGAAVSFAPGRDLRAVIETARATRPSLLAVDSIQAIRDVDAPQLPGGPAQVRQCTDALVGLAKTEGIAVLLTGHVTKDGDLAGPRTLEHAVDVVLTFEGDPRSGLRTLTGGKNRFGAEGETAWFEMGANGLHEIDPTELLRTHERVAGAATALPRSGRRALAVEVQALVGSPDGPGRRQTTGIDLRRFQLVAAVLDRTSGLPLARAELFGAASGGIRLDDPACDLAIAAALASAATGVPPPERAAFVGEVGLTGTVRPVSVTSQRFAAAAAAGCSVVFAPTTDPTVERGLRVVPVHRLTDAIRWAVPDDAANRRPRTA